MFKNKLDELPCLCILFYQDFLNPKRMFFEYL